MSEDNLQELVFSCGSQGLNSGCQAWRQPPLPAQPSYRPCVFDLHCSCTKQKLFHPKKLTSRDVKFPGSARAKVGAPEPPGNLTDHEVLQGEHSMSKLGLMI